MSAAATAERSAKAAAAWKAPPVDVGDVVLWYMNGVRDGVGRPAMVVGRFQNNLALHIFEPGAANFRLKESVRHVEDPRVKIPELAEDGAWEETPQHKRAAALEVQVRELTETVQRLARKGAQT